MNLMNEDKDQDWIVPNKWLAKEYLNSSFPKLNHSLEKSLRLFLSSKDGLESQFEENEFDFLFEMVGQMKKGNF